jgi:lipopolysaccharide/colanic/teichoic acid biosynthesis glycosyltransferase
VGFAFDALPHRAPERTAGVLEMSLQMGTKIGLSKRTDFFVLFASWYVFGWLFQTAHYAAHVFPIWVLLTSSLSMMFLVAIGYFDHHIPKPYLNGILSLFVALPISALVAKWLLMLTSHVPSIRYSQAFKASYVVAIVFEMAQVLIFKIHRAMGRKWTLVTHLHADELELLRAEIKQSEASLWIDIHSQDGPYPHATKLRGDETLVISRKAVRHLKDHPELLAAHLRGHRVVDVSQLLKEFRGRVNLHKTDGWTFLLGSTYQSFPIRFYFYAKEIIEVVLAFILLILSVPVLIGLALGVYMTSGRPIFYRQQRLGYRGELFYLYKFRTMPVTAESTGPQWAAANDPRTTKFGRWLRRTRMDELPQLVNVIKGDLSFVGPRPERPEFYAMLSEKIPLFATRLLVRPGITGWAQVRQGYAASLEECITKLEYDLYYVQHMSPALDLHVMISTAALMFRGNSGQ